MLTKSDVTHLIDQQNRLAGLGRASVSEEIDVSEKLPDASGDRVEKRMSVKHLAYNSW
jgi:hypothetical protein